MNEMKLTIDEERIKRPPEHNNIRACCIVIILKKKKKEEKKKQIQEIEMMTKRARRRRNIDLDDICFITAYLQQYIFILFSRFFVYLFVITRSVLLLIKFIISKLKPTIAIASYKAFRGE